MYEIEEDGDSEFLSWSSSILSKQYEYEQQKKNLQSAPPTNVNRILDSTLLNVKIFPRGRSLTEK
jgi:hypothetical protein